MHCLITMINFNVCVTELKLLFFFFTKNWIQILQMYVYHVLVQPIYFDST